MNADSGPATRGSDRDGAIADDLERRVDQLLTLDDTDLGSFGAIDWVLLVVGSIVLPVIAFILAA